MRKKIISGFLALAMVFTSVPTNVIALGTGGIGSNYGVVQSTFSSSREESTSSTDTDGGKSFQSSGSSSQTGSTSSTSTSQGSTFQSSGQVGSSSSSTSSTTSSSSTSSTTSSSSTSSTTSSSSTSSTTSSSSSLSSSNNTQFGSGNTNNNSSNTNNSTASTAASYGLATLALTAGSDTVETLEVNNGAGTQITDATVMLEDKALTHTSLGVYNNTALTLDTNDEYYTATITHDDYLTATYYYVYFADDGGSPSSSVDDWLWLEKVPTDYADTATAYAAKLTSLELTAIVTANLTGTVTDSAGAPISGATVTIGGASPDSNVSGLFTYNAYKTTTPDGATDYALYEVKISHTGYLEITVYCKYDGSNWEWYSDFACTSPLSSLTLYAPMTISGSVVDSTDGAIDAPLTSVEINGVSATISNTNDFELEVSDDASITYKVDITATGYDSATIYYVNKSGAWGWYENSTGTISATLELTPSSTVTTTGSVTGTLMNGSDRVSGFTVTIVGGSDKYEVPSGTDSNTFTTSGSQPITAGVAYTFTFHQGDTFIYEFTTTFETGANANWNWDASIPGWDLGNIDIQTAMPSSHTVTIKLGNQTGASGSTLEYDAYVSPGVQVSTNNGSSWSTNLTGSTTLNDKPASTTQFKIQTGNNGYLEYSSSTLGVSNFSEGVLPIFLKSDFKQTPNFENQIGWTADNDVYFCFYGSKVETDDTGGTVVYIKAGEFIPIEAFSMDINTNPIHGMYVTGDTTLTAVWGTDVFSFELSNNNFYFDKYSNQSYTFFSNSFITVRTDIIYTASIGYGEKLVVRETSDALIAYVAWTPVVTEFGKSSKSYVTTSEDLAKVQVQVTGISDEAELELQFEFNDVIYTLTATDTETTTDGVTYICYVPSPNTKTLGYLSASNGYQILKGGEIELAANVESVSEDCIVKFMSIFKITLDSDVFYSFSGGEYTAECEAGEKITFDFKDFRKDDSMVFESWVITNTNTNVDITKDLITGTNASTTTFTMPENHITISATYRDSDGYIVYFYEVSGNNTDLTQDYLSVGDLVEEPDDPTRYGYTFTGWYTSSDWKTLWDFDTELTSSHMDSSDKMVLYAGWEAHMVTIEMNYNGSTGYGNTHGKEYQVGDQITIDAGTKSGAMFSYWSWSSNNWDTSSSTVPSMENTDYCSSNSNSETTIIVPPVENGKILTITANWENLAAYLTIDNIVSPETNGDSCTVILSNPTYGSITGQYDEDFSSYSTRERYHFDLENAGAGMYSVDISSSSGQYMTGVFYISEDQHNYHSIDLLPVGKIPSIYNGSNSVSNVASNNMNEMFTASELTSSANVTIDMVVQDVSTSSIDAQQILSSLSATQGVGIFIDVTLQKNIDGSKFTMQPANSKGLNVVLQLPDSFKNQKGYFVSTVHEGVYSQLANVSYDSDSNSISFYTTNLSVFGIGYTGGGSSSTGFNSSIPTASGYNIPIFQNVMVGQWIEGLGQYELVHPEPTKWKFAGWYYGETGISLTQNELDNYFVVTQGMLDHGIFPRFVQVDGDGNPLSTPVPSTGVTTLAKLF